MRCRVCENEIRPDTKFCRFCGTPVPLVEFCETSNTPARRDDDSNRCKVCGMPLIAGNKYCTHCGTIVDRAGQETRETESDQRLVNDGDMIVCPKCGKTIGVGNRFCTNCGTSFEKKMVDRYGGVSGTGSKKKKELGKPI